MRKEVQDLQDKVRLELVIAAEKCFDEVMSYLPGEGEPLGAQAYARIRWAMLKAGFSHDEIVGVISKLKAADANKKQIKTILEWAKMVGVTYLEPINDQTSSTSLLLKKAAYARRLSGVVLDPHERLVFLTGKRLREIMDSLPEAEQGELISGMSKDLGIIEELLWRVATGGHKVAGVHLEKINRWIRQFNFKREQDEDAKSMVAPNDYVFVTKEEQAVLTEEQCREVESERNIEHMLATIAGPKGG